VNSSTSAWRINAFDVLEGRSGQYLLSRLIPPFIVALIVANGAAVILESNRALFWEFREFFVAFELFSVVVFSIEYLARIWTAPEHDRFAGLPRWRARLRYAVSPMALLDFMAIAPFYLSLMIAIDLRYLRLFRLLRLLKLAHYFDGLQVFGAVLKREGRAIFGALMIMIILITVSACLMFTIENAARPGHFESIGHAIWWAVVTLTTVGYGDITPITWSGKLLGIVIMLLGVGTMALPAGIMAARFTEELQNRREMIRSRVIEALSDGQLDDVEAAAIREMQQELGLSEEDVSRIVSVQLRLTRQKKSCPHCGEAL